MATMVYSTPPPKADHFRELEPHWNGTMIAASIAVSFLGSFTSTQLMCHARMSVRFSTALLWTLLGSLIFGFCSIWCLHYIAMLACEFDLRIGVDPLLTIISALLAVLFTFIALSTDLLWDNYHRGRRKKSRRVRKHRRKISLEDRPSTLKRDDSSSRPHFQRGDFEDESDEENDIPGPSQPLLGTPVAERDATLDADVRPSMTSPAPSTTLVKDYGQDSSAPQPLNGASLKTTSSLASAQDNVSPHTPGTETASTIEMTESHTGTSASDYNPSRRSSSGTDSGSSFGLGSAMSFAYRKGSVQTMNAFLATANILWNGLTFKSSMKGFLWSLAITSMHYVGIFSLQIPEGYVTLKPWLVLVSALISWVVCLVGVICMAEMEVRLSQQLLFSAVATAGVAGMHFTGMVASEFKSWAPPSEIHGYPTALATAVVGIAFATCIAANGLLAHSATVSRNKLAEIIWTRRELWRTIAQKENAEAAALARSEFIASASHEIRTPLHHLQGYSDLLSQTRLTEEGRSHLAAIQRATKTLSLITNNVLDWSKLEKDAKAVCKPVALDMRLVCESIIVLLPNIDDELEVELYVVVSPDVPATVFLDETYIHRILMNLLSNAFKFTRSGYISLNIEMKKDNLVITVKDTGCGLEPSFIPEMWTPYKQGEIRGTQRGTGLGLSIIKQLLHAMNGTITVESKFVNADDVLPGESGSTFIITIPAKSTMAPPKRPLSQGRPQVAVLYEGTSRALEGLRASWESFGYDVTVAKKLSDLPNYDWKYVWAHVPFLSQNKEQFNQLMKQNKWLVLVPYDNETTLGQLPGMLSTSRFAMLPKPLIWHNFEKRIAKVSERAGNTDLSRTLRFAPEVEIIANGGSHREEVATEKRVILLVEDNPVRLSIPHPHHRPLLTRFPDKPKISQENDDIPRP